MVQGDVVKDISFLEGCQQSCLVVRNHLGNFGRGHYEEHFNEIILNPEFGPLVQMLFKDISYLELWQPSCLVEWNHLDNLWNISVKSF